MTKLDIWKVSVITYPNWLSNYTRIEKLMDSEAVADIYTSDNPLDATKRLLQNVGRDFEIKQIGNRVYIRDPPHISHYCDPYNTYNPNDPWF